MKGLEVGWVNLQWFFKLEEEKEAETKVFLVLYLNNSKITSMTLYIKSLDFSYIVYALIKRSMYEETDLQGHSS